MTNYEMRPQQIRQIPVFALRQAVSRLTDEQDLEPVLRARMEALLNIKPKQIKRAIQRLSREQLTRLIDACPEIGDAKVQELFEEYRYGANPSFYVYLFKTVQLESLDIEDLRSRFEASLKSFNAELEEGLPRLRRIELNDLLSLPDRPEIIEGTYRFQARLDYIDENQNAVSTYQTLYGFFWLNTSMAYSIIQARSPEVLQALARAIEAGAGVRIYPLVISKQLKNSLPFLMQDAFRSGRLYDPNPESKRFHWVTITDDAPYDKGYEEYETNYPEVRSARYRELVANQKETSLTIRCDRGAFGLAGKLRASQFREWCLDRLGKLIEVLNSFRSHLPEQVQTQQLMNAPELIRFTAEQKTYVLMLISALLILKQAPELVEQFLAVDILDLAAVLGNYVRVQVPYECAEPDCDEQAYLASRDCDSAQFILLRQNSQWGLKCFKGRRQEAVYTFPLSVKTELGHEFVIDKEDVARTIEILPGKDLLAAISATINRRLPGYNFDATSESFILRGDLVVYYPNPPALDSIRNVFYIHQEVGTVESGGAVTGATMSGSSKSKKVRN
jgi:hypothetical protein